MFGTGKKILDRLNGEAYKGRLLAILGPSGAGMFTNEGVHCSPLHLFLVRAPEIVAASEKSFKVDAYFRRQDERAAGPGWGVAAHQRPSITRGNGRFMLHKQRKGKSCFCRARRSIPLATYS
jgi:hypothetical protein